MFVLISNNNDSKFIHENRRLEPIKGLSPWSNWHVINFTLLRSAIFLSPSLVGFNL